MTKKMSSQRGVTLIEILITFVIIGVVAAMAVPRLQTAYERLKFKTANKKVNSTLRLARSLSISDKEPYGVYIDNTTMTLTLFKDKVNQAGFVYESADSVCRVDTLPNEFNMAVTDVTNSVFIFGRNGSCHFTGGGNIYTFAYSETAMNFTTHNVLASTGRVHSSTYDPSYEGDVVN